MEQEVLRLARAAQTPQGAQELANETTAENFLRLLATSTLSTDPEKRKALCLQLLGIAAAATKLLTSGTQPQPGGSSLDQKAAAVVSTMTVVSLFHAVESGLGVAGVGTALDRQLAQAAAALGPSYAKMPRHMAAIFVLHGHLLWKRTAAASAAAASGQHSQPFAAPNNAASAAAFALLAEAVVKKPSLPALLALGSSSTSPSLRSLATYRSTEGGGVFPLPGPGHTSEMARAALSTLYSVLKTLLYTPHPAVPAPSSQSTMGDITGPSASPSLLPFVAAVCQPYSDALRLCSLTTTSGAGAVAVQWMRAVVRAVKPVVTNAAATSNNAGGDSGASSSSSTAATAAQLSQAREGLTTACSLQLAIHDCLWSRAKDLQAMAQEELDKGAAASKTSKAGSSASSTSSPTIALLYLSLATTLRGCALEWLVQTVGVVESRKIMDSLPARLFAVAAPAPAAPSTGTAAPTLAPTPAPHRWDSPSSLLAHVIPAARLALLQHTKLLAPSFPAASSAAVFGARLPAPLSSAIDPLLRFTSLLQALSATLSTSSAPPWLSEGLLKELMVLSRSLAGIVTPPPSASSSSSAAAASAGEWLAPASSSGSNSANNSASNNASALVGEALRQTHVFFVSVETTASSPSALLPLLRQGSSEVAAQAALLLLQDALSGSNSGVGSSSPQMLKQAFSLLEASYAAFDRCEKASKVPADDHTAAAAAQRDDHQAFLQRLFALWSKIQALWVKAPVLNVVVSPLPSLPSSSASARGVAIALPTKTPSGKGVRLMMAGPESDDEAENGESVAQREDRPSTPPSSSGKGKPGKVAGKGRRTARFADDNDDDRDCEASGASDENERPAVMMTVVKPGAAKLAAGSRKALSFADAPPMTIAKRSDARDAAFSTTAIVMRQDAPHADYNDKSNSNAPPRVKRRLELEAETALDSIRGEKVSALSFDVRAKLSLGDDDDEEREAEGDDDAGTPPKPGPATRKPVKGKKAKQEDGKKAGKKGISFASPPRGRTAGDEEDSGDEREEEEDERRAAALFSKTPAAKPKRGDRGKPGVSMTAPTPGLLIASKLGEDADDDEADGETDNYQDARDGESDREDDDEDEDNEDDDESSFRRFGGGLALSAPTPAVKRMAGAGAASATATRRVGFPDNTDQEDDEGGEKDEANPSRLLLATTAKKNPLGRRRVGFEERLEEAEDEENGDDEDRASSSVSSSVASLSSSFAAVALEVGGPAKKTAKKALTFALPSAAAPPAPLQTAKKQLRFAADEDEEKEPKAEEKPTASQSTQPLASDPTSSLAWLKATETMMGAISASIRTGGDGASAVAAPSSSDVSRAQLACEAAAAAFQSRATRAVVLLSFSSSSASASASSTGDATSTCLRRLQAMGLYAPSSPSAAVDASQGGNSNSKKAVAAAATGGAGSELEAGRVAVETVADVASASTSADGGVTTGPAQLLVGAGFEAELISAVSKLLRGSGSGSGGLEGAIKALAAALSSPPFAQSPVTLTAPLVSAIAASLARLFNLSLPYVNHAKALEKALEKAALSSQSPTSFSSARTALQQHARIAALLLLPCCEGWEALLKAAEPLFSTASPGSGSDAAFNVLLNGAKRLADRYAIAAAMLKSVEATASAFSSFSSRSAFLLKAPRLGSSAVAIPASTLAAGAVSACVRSYLLHQWRAELPKETQGTSAEAFSSSPTSVLPTALLAAALPDLGSHLLLPGTSATLRLQLHIVAGASGLAATLRRAHVGLLADEDEENDDDEETGGAKGNTGGLARALIGALESLDLSTLLSSPHLSLAAKVVLLRALAAIGVTAVEEQLEKELPAPAKGAKASNSDAGNASDSDEDESDSLQSPSFSPSAASAMLAERWQRLIHRVWQSASASMGLKEGDATAAVLSMEAWLAYLTIASAGASPAGMSVVTASLRATAAACVLAFAERAVAAPAPSGVPAPKKKATTSAGGASSPSLSCEGAPLLAFVLLLRLVSQWPGSFVSSATASTKGRSKEGDSALPAHFDLQKWSLSSENPHNAAVSLREVFTAFSKTSACLLQQDSVSSLHVPSICGAILQVADLAALAVDETAAAELRELTVKAPAAPSTAPALFESLWKSLFDELGAFFTLPQALQALHVLEQKLKALLTAQEEGGGSGTKSTKGKAGKDLSTSYSALSLLSSPAFRSLPPAFIGYLQTAMLRAAEAAVILVYCSQSAGGVDVPLVLQPALLLSSVSRFQAARSSLLRAQAFATAQLRDGAALAITAAPSSSAAGGDAADAGAAPPLSEAQVYSHLLATCCGPIPFPSTVSSLAFALPGSSLLSLQCCSLLRFSRVCFAIGDLSRSKWSLGKAIALLWSNGLSAMWLDGALAAENKGPASSPQPCTSLPLVPAVVSAHHLVTSLLFFDPAMSAEAAPQDREKDGSLFLRDVNRSLLAASPSSIVGFSPTSLLLKATSDYAPLFARLCAASAHPVIASAGAAAATSSSSQPYLGGGTESFRAAFARATAALDSAGKTVSSGLYQLTLAFFCLPAMLPLSKWATGAAVDGKKGISLLTLLAEELCRPSCAALTLCPPVFRLISRAAAVQHSQAGAAAEKALAAFAAVLSVNPSTAFKRVKASSLLLDSMDQVAALAESEPYAMLHRLSTPSALSSLAFPNTASVTVCSEPLSSSLIVARLDSGGDSFVLTLPLSPSPTEPTSLPAAVAEFYSILRACDEGYEKLSSSPPTATASKLAFVAAAASDADDNDSKKTSKKTKNAGAAKKPAAKKSKGEDEEVALDGAVSSAEAAVKALSFDEDGSGDDSKKSKTVVEIDDADDDRKSVSSVSSTSSAYSRAQREAWWQGRHALDARMKALCDSLQKRVLGIIEGSSNSALQAFASVKQPGAGGVSALQAPPVSLKTTAAPSAPAPPAGPVSLSVALDKLSSLTLVELRQEGSKCGFTSSYPGGTTAVAKLKKDALVAALKDFCSSGGAPIVAAAASSSPSDACPPSGSWAAAAPSSAHCLFLPDEGSHMLPWEGMPFLTEGGAAANAGRVIRLLRLPCFNFAVATVPASTDGNNNDTKGSKKADAKQGSKGDRGTSSSVLLLHAFSSPDVTSLAAAAAPLVEAGAGNSGWYDSRLLQQQRYTKALLSSPSQASSAPPPLLMSCLLNPESDLPRTQDRLAPFFSALTKAAQELLPSAGVYVAGRAPSAPESQSMMLIESLSSPSSPCPLPAYVYSGHGGGEGHISALGKHLQALLAEGVNLKGGADGKKGRRPVPPALRFAGPEAIPQLPFHEAAALLGLSAVPSLLMGCSSARMVASPLVSAATSLGNKSDAAAAEGSGSSSSSSLLLSHYSACCWEPQGTPLKLLLAGSPAVVGCGWDVTDKDADAYTTALVSGLSALDLPASVEAARSSCKLKFLVGAAPVVYALPGLSLPSSGV